MENIIIKEFRKQTGEETGNDGVVRPRTRPFIIFNCYHCNNDIEIHAASFRPTKPCKNCQKSLRGKANFLRKAKDKFGDKFDLTKAEVEYTNPTTPVTIKCNIHQCEYKITPVRFTAKPYPNQPAKGGCPECARAIQLQKNKKSIDHYLTHLEDKFPSIGVISHGTAESNLEHITLNCPEHGEFTTTLAKIISQDPSRTNLCQKCSKEKLAWRSRMARTDIPGQVYFVRFKDVNLYKCGVTYRTVNERLKGHLQNIEQIWTIQFPTLSDAYFFEYQFFREFKNYRCNHPDSTIGGYTEFLTKLINKPTKRFIEEILCRKESNSEKLPPSYDEDNSERSPI